MVVLKQGVGHEVAREVKWQLLETPEVQLQELKITLLFFYS